MADDPDRAYQITSEVFPDLTFVPESLAWDIATDVEKHEKKLRSIVLKILKHRGSKRYDPEFSLISGIADMAAELLTTALHGSAWIIEGNPPEIYNGEADVLYTNALEFARRKYKSLAAEIPKFYSARDEDFLASLQSILLELREEAKQHMEERYRELNARAEQENRIVPAIVKSPVVGHVPHQSVQCPVAIRDSATALSTCFLRRASWLKERLHERAWNKHDLARQGGPDHKTVQKILDGFRVREDVLQKVADALSKKHASVAVTEIPEG